MDRFEQFQKLSKAEQKAMLKALEKVANPLIKDIIKKREEEEEGVTKREEEYRRQLIAKYLKDQTEG